MVLKNASAKILAETLTLAMETAAIC
ncbi:hypothetical protein CY0110_23406 [Crocosphaera chwakensis CCY0110]|uniref:Uncharacterized protein n=1 Tax=Crocosphaera chwakensis CCY0110 TaxID=391612 RepID=A3ILB5_9CHRO|nr:hypothetical protein CY0110_23406 [Crocosphaera chwakensis CCY0110]